MLPYQFFLISVIHFEIPFEFLALTLLIRLQGPLSANGIGRVEIYYNGEWGTVCDNSWDIRDAMVACRQLGYENAVSALQGDQVPNGNRRIWLDGIFCTGTEKNLFACSHHSFGTNECGHSKDAGVHCYSAGNVIFNNISNSLVV